MTGWFASLFAPRPCPGCGREFIEWTETDIEQGYSLQRNWEGCPEYMRLLGPAQPGRALDALAERRKHYAVWRPGRRTPLHMTTPTSTTKETT